MLQSILGTTTPFSGDDVRWGVESRWAGRGWELQGEYLRAILGDSTASGYYALGEHDLGSDYQLAASVERLAVPNPQLREGPWYIVGASRLIAGQRDKPMLDVRVQPGEPSTAYAGTVQWQLLFR